MAWLFRVSYFPDFYSHLLVSANPLFYCSHLHSARFRPFPRIHQKPLGCEDLLFQMVDCSDHCLFHHNLCSILRGRSCYFQYFGDRSNFQNNWTIPVLLSLNLWNPELLCLSKKVAYFHQYLEKNRSAFLRKLLSMSGVLEDFKKHIVHWIWISNFCFW